MAVVVVGAGGTCKQQAVTQFLTSFQQVGSTDSAKVRNSWTPLEPTVTSALWETCRECLRKQETFFAL